MIIDDFPGRESLVAAVAKQMRLYGLTPEQVLGEYRSWLARQGRQIGEGQGGMWISGGGWISADGKHARVAQACPYCNGTVELVRLCPRVSPQWRAQLACMADDCSWHGLSTLPVSELVAGGREAIRNNTETR